MKKLLFILPLFFFGCKSIQYVPVETTRTEYQDRFQRDSVFIQDSIFIRHKGDTIFLEKYKTIYKDRVIKDSIFIKDSINIPYPIEVVKEINRLRNWQIIFMVLGGVLIGYIVFRVIRFLKM